MNLVVCGSLFVIILALGQTVHQQDTEIIPGGFSGTGIQFGFWDCCKPSCAWKGNVTSKKGPFTTCTIDGMTKIDIDSTSGCDKDGTSYICTNQQPWVIDDTLAYGFITASLKGAYNGNFCCGCLMLNFEDPVLIKKKMIVQYFDTGDYLYPGQINLAMPGSNLGENPLGCDSQWNATANGWGKPYWEIKNKTQCELLPKQLQKGCVFRYDFLKGLLVNPVTYVQVKCPAEIVAVSGCELNV